MTLEEQVEIVEKALKEKKAVDVKAYDVRGAAAPHLKALVAGTQRAMREAGVASYRTSGDPESGWIVVDYVDVVVHVFSPEARAYYALERLWEKPAEKKEGDADAAS